MLDLTALDLRLGRVLSLEPHPNPEAKQLLVARVDVGAARPLSAPSDAGENQSPASAEQVGGAHRQVVLNVNGISEPQQLVGRLLVFLCNLKPVKIKGVESQALLLCARK